MMVVNDGGAVDGAADGDDAVVTVVCGKRRENESVNGGCLMR